MFPIPFNFPFIKKNGERTTIGDAIDAGGGGGSYTLPTASAETKGGVKIGSGLTMTGEVLSNNNPTPYSLPTASAETLGGVKVGSGLSIVEGVLSATGGSGGGGFHLYKFSSNNGNFRSGYIISNYDTDTASSDNAGTKVKKTLYNGIGVVTGLPGVSNANRILGIVTIDSITASKVSVQAFDFAVSDNSIAISDSVQQPEFSYMSNLTITKVF